MLLVCNDHGYGGHVEDTHLQVGCKLTILIRKIDFESICDVKVIGGECVLQHKLLVAGLERNTWFSKSHSIPPK